MDLQTVWIVIYVYLNSLKKYTQNKQNKKVPALNTKVTECEECETENAVWKCVQCEQSLCAMCEVELHKKGARARHTRIPMSYLEIIHSIHLFLQNNKTKWNEM